MRKLLATCLVLATFNAGVTSVAVAQNTQPAQTAPAQPTMPADHSAMMGGDMSAMMTRMNKMMDACEKMMQSTNEKRDRPPR